MNIQEKWTTQLKYNIQGVMYPIIDPFDRSAFYISDGLQTPFSAMRLRKLSLETGQELANVLTKDATRCIYANTESIYAVLSKRILQLARNDLHVESVYSQKIPRDMGSVSSDDAETLLLLNHYTGALHRFHLPTSKDIRRNIGNGGDCNGIERINAETFLIFTGDAFLQYSLSSNALRKLTDTECYTCYARGNSGKVYILCKEPDIEGKVTPYSSRILVYSSISGEKNDEIIPGEICGVVRISEDENLLYLYNGNTLWIYSLSENKILFRHIFQDGNIMNVFAEASTVLTYNMSCCILSCWQIEGEP